MKQIQISNTLNREIEKLINDDFVKREFGYTSVDDFVVYSIEGNIEADKDIAMIKD